ncbi:NAD(P)-dependent oxidoreductase [Ferrovibrio sp.]|uniref:NAD-dependent epimerase/dehydratase family protein n=1 Tax=Ferrovibrio sp. TaxID=1917215 RepID=UPI0025BAFC63|nr:NAD(P)-dependent oxidoreductase [Ferrovibrio sp.]MBX3455112.1 NAD(P)-dependent oxidoreductase [Ferrovibrio sp.]
MRRVLLTGASGGVGTRLRKLLKPLYPELILSDLKPPADLRPDETFIAADLADADAVSRACAGPDGKGIDGIVHLGGYSIEGPWDTILQANIIGCYNLFEAARRQGVKRVVFASSNHVVGFHRRDAKIGNETVPLPDTRYGVSKLFGEGLGALYAHKHGLGVLSIRIGNVGEEPLDQRRMSIWLEPNDLVSLIRIGLERPGLVYEVVYGMSDNASAWWDNRRALELGYKPQARSADHLAAAMAGQAKLPPDPLGDLYQGGPFCSQEYDADKRAR